MLYSSVRRCSRVVTSFIKQESGETALEYGLIAALISITGIFFMRSVASELSHTFHYTGSAMASARAT
ncbi:MAG: Flp family type IVb pilin [Methylobacteriaceae bacterium]|nr:Flp family type IVb pilin [Methylobacteriaceae bacterium]